ncbi:MULTISPECIES: type II toxin-antitoxin system HipA family toxin [unclassified Cryobacterium]|uniref:type II toxin-antitoxin system HipA family toxin n=1 Tax=unclassified Cryobacterium TaxID=2649013 RepID=UPI001069E552|nr:MULTISPECIES: HipA domain-containing protein [unclassified Cryobacterium]TFB95730.1 type II toxin-antitoxin system HipA family toxin [Cryobacterium sp. MDB2-A-1]TFC12044.1 type II toxin-antitoxin system HipA family toxin [Cryobacterium sp. MDB2-A-2]
MSEALAVFLHDDYIGEVVTYRRGRQHDKSRVNFTWDSGYQPGNITLTESFASLPGVQPDATLVSNFFGGYAPDGNHRAAMAKRRGIDPGDLFGLLREFGGSIGGALTFRDPDEPPKYTPRYEQLDEGAVAQRLRQAVKQHDLGTQDDSRSMLPGYQPKLLLARFGSGWYQPHGRAHSTHILKPELTSRPGNIHNEFYSHELARHMKLSRFASEIITFGQTTFLAIERFDRSVTGNTVSLIHQEDVAQALGLDWRDSDAKFQDPAFLANPARPSALRVAELTGTFPDSDGATTEWLRQLVFHVLVGDNDAHAKNVGLIHDANGTSVSELYDAVPNFFQPGRMSWDMAMAVDGVFDHRKVSIKRLVAEAASWSVLRPDRIEATIQATIHEFIAAQAAIPAPTGVNPGVVERLAWNAARLTADHEISRPKEH